MDISNFLFPVPTDEQVSLKEYLLPQEDERLEELFIEREDMRLSDNLPIKGENRPIRDWDAQGCGQGERA